MGESMRGKVLFCCFAVGLVSLLMGCDSILNVEELKLFKIYTEVSVNWVEDSLPMSRNLDNLFVSKQIPEETAKYIEKISLGAKDLVIEEFDVETVKVMVDPSTPEEQSYTFTKNGFAMWTPTLNIGDHTIVAIENGSGASSCKNYGSFSIKAAKTVKITIYPGLTAYFYIK